MSIHPSNPENMLGRRVYLMRQQGGSRINSRIGSGTVASRSRGDSRGRCVGIEWRVVGVDRPRRRITLRSVVQWDVTRESSLETFMQMVREGALELE